MKSKLFFLTLLVIFIFNISQTLGLSSEKAKKQSNKILQVKNNSNDDNKLLYKEIGGIKFVKIPTGEFIMGSPGSEGENDEHPQHKVKINSIWFGIYEITQDQYRNIISKNPSYYKGGNLPVEQLTWDDAMLFCKIFSEKQMVKMRLPTEAEWEYACRAGTTTKYYWGNNIRSDYGWYGKNAKKTTHPPGQKKPNAWGIYDMSGNVWEWCMDWYNEKYYMISPKDNPTGPNLGDYRIVRGGGLYREYGLRSACRSSAAQNDYSDSVGFRVVIEP